MLLCRVLIMLGRNEIRASDESEFAKTFVLLAAAHDCLKKWCSCLASKMCFHVGTSQRRRHLIFMRPWRAELSKTTWSNASIDRQVEALKLMNFFLVNYTFEQPLKVLTALQTCNFTLFVDLKLRISRGRSWALIKNKQAQCDHGEVQNNETRRGGRVQCKNSDHHLHPREVWV